jgi:pimeloyl-ACP methyl ester carboxylesterase
MNTIHPITVTRGPAHMHVSTLGEGPSIVFVHGGGEGGLSAWNAQLPLAERFRLVVPYRPGYGESPSLGGEDFEAHAVPIAELLRDGAHLVGQSYGAIVAMLAAARRPEAVRSLTLIESGSSSIARGRPGVDDYERRMGAIASAPPSDVDERVRAVFAILDPKITLPRPLPPPLVRWGEAMPSFRWPWEAQVPVDALRAAGFPILALSGGQRAMYEEIADALADALDAERAVIPGPHALQTVGAPFNEQLVAFIDRAEAQRSSTPRRRHAAG